MATRGWLGSFIELYGAKYILTNEHVAAARHSGEKLGFQFNGQDRLALIQGNHVEQAWPWDLALLPVNEATWAGTEHTSKAMQIDQIALAHTPVRTEVFAFTGFAGKQTRTRNEAPAVGRLKRETCAPAGNDVDGQVRMSPVLVLFGGDVEGATGYRSQRERRPPA